ncbi:MAG: cupin domain-containing protein [Firmicutes bacterium]|nr:cupin domain-containing protein [Bacillota bacterium]
MKISNLSETTNKGDVICTVTEYPTHWEEMNMAAVKLCVRHPASGFRTNTKVKEACLVTKGGGKITKSDGQTFSFQKGDIVYIEVGDKYFWDAKCELVIACTPRWTPEQSEFTQH